MILLKKKMDIFVDVNIRTKTLDEFKEVLKTIIKIFLKLKLLKINSFILI